jgi:Na+-transporting NADH:ubiquinone oxidoreductase subunit C
MSLTSVLLKPRQDQQVELDTKKKILGAVMDISSYTEPADILALYAERVESVVVDINGDPVEMDAKGNPMIAEKVNIQRNYKIEPAERLYPVFKFREDPAGEVTAYVLPMFGAGLWDWISCFIAIEGDLNTIKGIAFDHKGETPGLGARIASEEVQSRFVGKKLFKAGELVSVVMLKGEGNPGLSDHEVDGMSGATITAKGVNKMIENYMKLYEDFIEKQKESSNVAYNIQ